jgi:N-acetylated-alpha-linked acidic dipeptidase
MRPLIHLLFTGLVLPIGFCLTFAAALSAQPAVPQGFLPASVDAEKKREAQLLSLTDPKNCEAYLYRLTEKPHHAASVADHETALYVDSLLKTFGFVTRIDSYAVYLPYPTAVSVRMLEPKAVPLAVREPQWTTEKKQDITKSLRTALLPYNAYSPSGNVTGDVVYANHGLPEDYEKLDQLGVSVKGKIVLVRYGGSFRGVKAQVAESKGAIGLLIYSDPIDDGYTKGDVFPNGSWRPAGAVQSGSLEYIFQYPGDPLTPGRAAVRNAERLNPADATNLPKIPTQPLSYADAELILKNLSGKVVPEGWQGGLPFAYHIGSGVKVNLDLKMDYAVRTIWNNIATMNGTGSEADQKIILGNHRDAWSYGAADPSSGTASLLETARSLGVLVKQGWQPKRTIEFCFWDAEEFGLIGSTEHGEDYSADLVQNAVVYLNVDVAVGGSQFEASGVPSLDGFLQEATKAVQHPSGKSVFAAWYLDENKSQQKRLARKGIPDSAKVNIERLGSGSDFTVFLDHLGIAATDMGFSGSYGVYHSTLDNFYWMKSFVDSTFELHATTSRLAGIMALRLAGADALPFNYADYAAEVQAHVKAIKAKLKDDDNDDKVNFSTLDKSLAAWKAASDSLNQTLSSSMAAQKLYVGLNHDLFSIERLFTTQAGLKGRDWFKHRIYAPGFYTGYAPQPLPGIAGAIEKEDWQTAASEAALLATLICQATDATRHITASLLAAK